MTEVRLRLKSAHPLLPDVSCGSAFPSSAAVPRGSIDLEEGPPTDMKRVDELSTSRPSSRVAGAAGRIKGVGDTRGGEGMIAVSQVASMVTLACGPERSRRR